MSREVRAGGGYVELGLRERLDAGLRSAEKKLRNFAKGAITIGGGMVGSAAAVIAPLLGAAGRAQEIRSKFDTVFGNSNTQMREWANNFASQVGRSKTQVEEFLSGSQDLFVPIGFDAAAAADMSQTVTQLAVDLGSFNDRADADVMNDLQAALTGSGEVMKKYGVIISEATVKQELLNQSIDPKNATDAQKVQARLNLIMAGTTAAQGDATRTAGSFTNQLKSLAAAGSDLAVQLGEHLIPPATAVLQWLNRGVSWVSKFATENSTLTKVILGTVAAVGAIGGILVAVGGAAAVGSVVIGGLSSVLGVIAAVAGAVAGPALAIVAVLAAVGVAAWMFRDQVSEWALAFWDSLLPVRSAVGQIADIFKATFSAVSAAIAAGDITAATTALWTGVTALFFRGAQFAGQAFEWLFGSTTGWMKGIADALIGGDLSLAGEILWAQLLVAFASGQAAVMQGWALFTGGLSDALSGAAITVTSIMRTVIDAMLGAIERGIDGMRKIVAAAAKVDPTGLAQKSLTAIDAGRSGLQTVRTTVSSAGSVVQNGLQAKRIADREALAAKLEQIDQRVAAAKQRRDEALDRAAAARGDKTLKGEADKRLKMLRDQAAAATKIGDEQKQKEIEDQAENPFSVSSPKSSAREGGTFSGVGAFLLGLGSGETTEERIARNTDKMVELLQQIEQKPSTSTATYS